MGPVGNFLESKVLFFLEETKKSQVGILPFHERIQFRRRFWTQFSTKDLAATSECVGKEIVTRFRLVVELAIWKKYSHLKYTSII